MHIKGCLLSLPLHALDEMNDIKLTFKMESDEESRSGRSSDDISIGEEMDSGRTESSDISDDNDNRDSNDDESFSGDGRSIELDLEDNEMEDNGSAMEDDEMEDDDSATEEEMDNGDDESTDNLVNAEHEYEDMIENLSDPDVRLQDLSIETTALLLLILENIDEFCDALSNVDEIFSFSLGSLKDWPKVYVTDNEGAWNTLCTTLQDIQIHRLLFNGQSLSGPVMAKILNSFPQVQEIWLDFPWNTVSGEDMQPLLDILSEHQCEDIEISLCGDHPKFASADEAQHYLSAEPENHLEDGGVLSQLLSFKKLTCVILRRVNLTLEECQAFASILTSKDSTFPQLRLEGCTFQDGGGQYVANAFRSNTSVNSMLHLENVCEDDSFSNALASSLPYNESFSSLYLQGRMRVKAFFNLLRNVALFKKTAITSFVIRDCDELWSELSDEQEQNLLDAFQQNHKIQCLNIDGDEPIRTITRLNEAGRSYLREDANDSEKFIQVLDGVKDDLSCLYLHLRENHVLFYRR